MLIEPDPDHQEQEDQVEVPGLQIRPLLYSSGLILATSLLATLLRRRTGWEFTECQPHILFLLWSVIAITYDAYMDHRRGEPVWFAGSICRAITMVLYALALGRDIMVRTPWPSAWTITAAVLLAAGWLFWARDLRRISA